MTSIPGSPSWKKAFVGFFSLSNYTSHVISARFQSMLQKAWGPGQRYDTGSEPLKRVPQGAVPWYCRSGAAPQDPRTKDSSANNSSLDKMRAKDPRAAGWSEPSKHIVMGCLRPWRDQPVLVCTCAGYGIKRDCSPTLWLNVFLFFYLYVTQAGLELGTPPTSTPQVVGLQAWTTMPEPITPFFICFSLLEWEWQSYVFHHCIWLIHLKGHTAGEAWIVSSISPISDLEKPLDFF